MQLPPTDLTMRWRCTMIKQIIYRFFQLYLESIYFFIFGKLDLQPDYLIRLVLPIACENFRVNARKIAQHLMLYPLLYRYAARLHH